ncbi:gas vesicle protein GvpL/GvpF [Salsuginibacillus halophilus]|uniref:Gas vesicle protein GvpL/GvpF n=1 Tax=Salsuginibacillus halophilus TaxID=517424 RepID=A0A2P8HLH4_9BACI|nr:GvpL/GvpF family gas vesicle protein [Salsuginibacillus halophilus]PSL47082.1 gas vesicle protein GvpL/GvpF [Salsuginibacillus halophilus]
MSETFVYIFGVARKNEHRTAQKVMMEGEPRSLRAVNEGDLDFIVTDVSEETLPPIEANVRGHKEALEAIMTEETVAPMSFGTILGDEQEARRLLQAIYDPVSEAMPKIDNKIEVTVQINLTEEAFKSLFAHKKKKPRSYKGQLALGEEAKAVMDRYRTKHQESIGKPLGDLSASSILKEPSTERTLFEGVFLIDREDEAAFDEAVNDLYSVWKEQTDFVYTGPWPAYSFVDMRFAAAERR